VSRKEIWVSERYGTYRVAQDDRGGYGGPLIIEADVVGLYPLNVAAVASALSNCNMTQPDGSTAVELDD
jgi:hypothetical protein